ncbi:DUF4082 domain-containing protein [Nonomuraea guangzhouensis]|uniref:DUF4082 domain-containing protein n=1 Tax=Nonomuraea guangzhouensis TaxID=1291555 RepID=A0ABW4G0B0_9ACTN|nr:DUF4082 domain-containing protein [Nonomuraea guangzhouensis]
MSKSHSDAPDRTAGTAFPETLNHEATSKVRCSRFSGNAGRLWVGVATAVVLVAGTLVGLPQTAGATGPVDIGDAAPYGVVAGDEITNTDLTTVTGDVAVSPGNTLTGFPPGTINGDRDLGNATAANVKADLVAAYNDIAGRTADFTVAAQLGGTTKGPGLYTSNTNAFTISGTLTLDAQGDPNAVFIFRANTLTTANVSNIALARGAQANNVFWQFNDTVALGTYSTFRGNVLAQDNVTVNFGASVNGRIFALNDFVHITGTDSVPATRITVPNDPPTTTTLTTSDDPSWRGEPVTLTAVVAQVSGTVVPAGEVVFKDGSTIIGSSNQDDDDVARITIPNFSAGAHHLTAVYLGGDVFDHEALIHFAPSFSPEVVQDVSDSLWNKQATPAVQSQPDTQAITVGVKFRASVSGVVHAVRFFKGALNTGTHTGSLWTSSGQLLASGTFSNETASGWQQMNFSTPVAIAANTTYVASYHTTSGNYSVTRPYFSSAFTNGPLTALANSTDPNGVYTYGATSTFPTSSMQATNYWVDVVFQPSDSLWDTVATPAVQSQPDTQAVTVGVKFRASTNGKIVALRFFKGASNTGTHTGALWSSGGQLLASATFSNETASGWQQVNFLTPVSITANTTYIASYHTTSGNYSVTRPYFTSAYTNGPLTALANGTDPNGVYTYGATSTFPTSSYQSTNYWIDPVFD